MISLSFGYGYTFSGPFSRLLDSQSNFEKIKQCFGLSKELPDDLVDEFKQASKEMREMIKKRLNS
jgi:hypothetical protein